VPLLGLDFVTEIIKLTLARLKNLLQGLKPRLVTANLGAEAPVS
jgi:hypothetical protein